MKLKLATDAGWRLRHVDWPPYHYAELRTCVDGKARLHRIRPDRCAEPITVEIDDLDEHKGWLVLDILGDLGD